MGHLLTAAIPTAAAQAGAAERSRTWELPPGSKALRVNGYDMAYAERGAGPTVLLVHGIFTDFRYFSGVMDAFPRNFRVIAVSLRHYYPDRWDGNGGDLT